ncbi:MAG: efflux RND transporter permease subunit [Nitrospira sp.]|nr:efflux RND transporter permease subunit [Nitrospira sp.]
MPPHDRSYRRALPRSAVSDLCAGIQSPLRRLYAFQQLDIVAYPDPSPPMVEVITQFPGWSAEEIERQITIPIEVALNGMPGLTDIRSLSIFGLSDVKIYFDFGTQYFFDRQEVINRLATVSLPQNVQPALSPWWAIAEIYRYELAGDGRRILTDLKTIQDWRVRRVPACAGIIDVTAFRRHDPGISSISIPGS